MLSDADCAVIKPVQDLSLAMQRLAVIPVATSALRSKLLLIHRGGLGTFLKYRRYRYSLLENQKSRGTFVGTFHKSSTKKVLHYSYFVDFLKLYSLKIIRPTKYKITQYCSVTGSAWYGTIHELQTMHQVTNHQKTVQNKLQIAVSAAKIRKNATISLAHRNGPQRIKRNPFILETTFCAECDKKIVRGYLMNGNRRTRSGLRWSF